VDERLREAAKEGNLVLYASLRGVLLNLVTSFRTRYKELLTHVHFLSSHPLPIYERIKSEIRAGLPTADVVIVPQYLIMQMAKEGLLRAYRSEEFKFYETGFYGEAGWGAMAVEPITMVHNSSVVTQLPTTSDELTEARWRGKVATQALTTFSEGMMGAYYLVSLKRSMGQKKWNSFIERMASNVKPVAYECLLHMTHAVARGEQQIGFPATLRKASLADAVEAGGLEQLYIRDLPLEASFRTVALVGKGAHPRTAELFFDFALSKAWQDEMGEKLDGMVPARPGTTTNYWVSNPLTKGIDFFPSDEDVRSFPHFVDRFRELGLK